MSYEKIFSVLGYKEMITRFVEAGYTIKSFDDYNPLLKHLILRHDVDMSLKYAADLAEIEMKEHINSTYFILMSSELYNPFSEKSRGYIKSIIKHGHKIGLHFDPTKYMSDNLEKGLLDEKMKLELITNYDINIFSFHRPGKNIKNLESITGNMLHTYMPKFIKDIGYCSDSRGKWYYGDPLKNPFFIEGRAIQLLTHPIWWVVKGKSPIEKINCFRKENIKIIDGEIKENCDIYK